MINVEDGAKLTDFLTVFGEEKLYFFTSRHTVWSKNYTF